MDPATKNSLPSLDVKRKKQLCKNGVKAPICQLDEALCLILTILMSLIKVDKTYCLEEWCQMKNQNTAQGRQQGTGTLSGCWSAPKCSHLHLFLSFLLREAAKRSSHFYYFWNHNIDCVLPPGHLHRAFSLLFIAFPNAI